MLEKAEKTQQAPKSTAHKLELDHLHGVSMTGVFAVPTFTDRTATVRLKDETLYVTGHDLEIKTLDIENGKLVLAGVVSELRYRQSSAPTSFVKRIFK